MDEQRVDRKRPASLLARKALAHERLVTNALAGPLGIINDIVRQANAAIRAQQQAISDLASEALSAPNRLMRSILEPYEAMRLNHQRTIGALANSFDNVLQMQQKLARTAFEPYNKLLQAHLQIDRSLTSQFAQMAQMTRAVSELSGLTAQINSSIHLQTLRWNQLIAQALENAQSIDEVPLEEVPDEDVRDSIFANYEGDEYLPEREAVSAELAKIPGFDSLSKTSKCVQLLTIAAKNPSEKVQALALGIAGNLLADQFGQPYPIFWLVLFVVIATISEIHIRLRVPQTRRLLKTVRVDDKFVRVVKYRCVVTEQPKAKAMKLGHLEVGAIVTITDKLAGWRQIYFVDRKGNQRLAWVRSKYLCKV